MRHLSPAILSISLVLSACAIFSPPVDLGALTMSAQTLKNGYLIQIRVDRPVGPVTAAITQGNWLLVTFADSLLDASSLGSFRSAFVDSVEVTHFSSALQLALHLTVAVRALEVIHVDPSPEVLISLFAPGPSQGGGRRGASPETAAVQREVAIAGIPPVLDTNDPAQRGQGDELCTGDLAE